METLINNYCMGIQHIGIPTIDIELRLNFISSLALMWYCEPKTIIKRLLFKEFAERCHIYKIQFFGYLPDTYLIIIQHVQSMIMISLHIISWGVCLNVSFVNRVRCLVETHK